MGRLIICMLTTRALNTYMAVVCKSYLLETGQRIGHYDPKQGLCCTETGEWMMQLVGLATMQMKKMDDMGAVGYDGRLLIEHRYQGCQMSEARACPYQRTVAAT